MFDKGVVGNAHDFSDIEAVDRAFAEKAKSKHDAEMETILSPLRADAIRVQAEASATILNARAKRGALYGAGALGFGAGIGMALFGASFLLNPSADIKMVGDQIALNGEVVGPHLTGPKGERGERGEKGDRGEAGMKGERGEKGETIAPPRMGQHMTPEEMERRSDYKSAVTHGRVLSITQGVIELDTGRKFEHLDSNYYKLNWTTSRYNGLPIYCRVNGQSNPHDGSPLYTCYSTVNDIVVGLTPTAGEVQ